MPFTKIKEMSTKIDLAQIIERGQLNKKEIAKQLFPTNSFPSMALARILKGEAYLNSEQLSKLALILNVDVSDLYADSDWEIRGSKNNLIFKKGTFTGELCSETWTTRLYDGASLFHEQILHKPSISLREYIDELNSLIKNK